MRDDNRLTYIGTINPCNPCNPCLIYILRSLCHPLLLNFIQCLLDIIQNIFDILDTY